MLAKAIHGTLGHPQAVSLGIKRRIKSYAGRRYGSLIDDSWSFDTEQYDRHQVEALRRIYAYARTDIPYYREEAERYRDLPAGPGTARELLAGLPILGKQTLRARNSEFWPSSLPRFNKMHTSSGTTGTPTRVAGTVWERGFVQAVVDAWFTKLTGKKRPRVLHVSGFATPSADSDAIIWEDRVTNHPCLSIYSLDGRHAPVIDRFIRSFQPDVIYGYPSAIHQLAVALGERPWKSQLIVATTSEVLEPAWRKEITATICRRVYDFYSAAEACFAAAECEAGALHLDPLLGVVELLDDDDRPVAPGEVGRVVATGLYRRSMPLVRYEIGDHARSTGFAVDCPCGLRWPTIGAVEGRDDDLVLTRDGRRIGHLASLAARNLDGNLVAEVQLIQRGYEEFECYLVTTTVDATQRTAIERAFRAEFTRRLNAEVAIHFHHVDRIPRGPNGKFKAVVVDFSESGDKANS